MPFSNDSPNLVNSYGEQGSVIIAQTLYDLFPPESIDADCVSPLNPLEFIQRILVPEAATELIREDMRYAVKDEALETLRESSKFGTTMFPDLDARGGIGDRIVRSRARARRKQAEEEIRLDEELERLTSEDDDLSRQCSDNDGRGDIQASKLKRSRSNPKGSSNSPEKGSRMLIDLSDSSVPPSLRKSTSRGRGKAPTADLDATPKVKPRPKFRKAKGGDVAFDDGPTPKAQRTSTNNCEETSDQSETTGGEPMKGLRRMGTKEQTRLAGVEKDSSGQAHTRYACYV